MLRLYVKISATLAADLVPRMISIRTLHICTKVLAFPFLEFSSKMI
jgi:hypothetical protein